MPAKRAWRAARYDWQALLCGLSAAIANGADPARQVDFVLAGLRAG